MDTTINANTNTVTITISNIQTGSRYCFINSDTGEVVEQGIAESSKVDLDIKPGTYDFRLRKKTYLPFTMENISVISNTGLHPIQMKDHIFTTPSKQPKQPKLNMHEVFDDAMFLLFGNDK